MINKEFSERTRIISIEDWYNLSNNDVLLNVKIQLNGNSMYPLIRKMRDYVTISPINRKIKRGDIVLFRRADGKYVVHRVKKINGSSVQTMGDNCSLPDHEITAERVIGYVTCVHRDSKTLNVDTLIWRKFGLLWLRLLPLRKLVSSVKNFLKNQPGDDSHE